VFQIQTGVEDFDRLGQLEQQQRRRQKGQQGEPVTVFVYLGCSWLSSSSSSSSSQLARLNSLLALVLLLLPLLLCCCSIMTELRQLSMMAARFPDFDLAGKEMFLDKVGAPTN
jgi:hypothetical protein